MIFDSFPIDEAEGAIMAHSLRIEGKTIKKGTILTADEIDLLRSAGHVTVMAALLESDDATEDEAAAALAGALKGEGIELTPAFTGRCNLKAAVHGILVVDGEGVQKLNLIDEAITFASLSSFSVVRPGEVVGTVKIIPFALPKASLLKAKNIIENNQLIKAVPFLPRKVGLILTRIDGGKESLLDKAATALETRLAAMGNEVAGECRCDHDCAAVAASIEKLEGIGCDLVIICGATATVDKRDTVPAGIEFSGGTVEHFGIPVDPGNLLVMGRKNDLCIIGMPGCARSLSVNGFDWILQRVMAGLSINRADFAALGVGGLLKEMVNRPLPRDHAVSGKAELVMLSESPKKIAAIILAAGQSTRMGEVNKLLEEVQGKVMMRHAVDAAMDSNVSSIIVVTGFEADKTQEIVKGLPVTTVYNELFAQGMSTSLKCGISALANDVDGAVVCLADMPDVTASHLNRLIELFDPDMDRAVCVSSYGGRRGNPVLWSRLFFPRMEELSGDEGARKLLREHGSVVHEVEMSSDAVLRDIDSPEALGRASGPNTVQKI
ncbi:MAG: molybdopterin-binding/glycosyltransferase family 2 protein [Rhodospirillales bacterium]|nr:molybdopterin-binding/glycosyltransferase family 2 protein [Rhodospirillales bacterium]